MLVATNSPFVIIICISHNAVQNAMGTFGSPVNNIHSAWPGLEARDREVDKSKPLPSWGLKSSAQRRKSLYLRNWWLGGVGERGKGDLQRRIFELGIDG